MGRCMKKVENTDLLSHCLLNQACTTQKAQSAKFINTNLPRAAKVHSTVWYFVVI